MRPELLLIGTPPGIALATTAAFVGVFAAGTAMAGWFVRPLGLVHVAGFWVAALLLVAALVLPVGSLPSLLLEAAGVLLTLALILILWRPHADRSADMASRP